MDSKQKALRFKEAFFIESLASTCEDLIDYTYKDEYKTPKKIITHEICVAIYKLLSGRALRLDNIPNKILKAAIDVIMLHIYHVFNACFKFKYYPHHFKKSITIVLGKHNKDDYTKAKFFRPVVLLNTLDKVLKAILAKCLSYLATKHALLPYIYKGGDKGTSTNYAYYYLLKQVYVTWNPKKWLPCYYLT